MFFLQAALISIVMILCCLSVSTDSVLLTATPDQTNSRLTLNCSFDGRLDRVLVAVVADTRGSLIFGSINKGLEVLNEYKDLNPRGERSMVEHLWVYLTFDMPYCSKFEGAICVILTDTGEREHAGIEFTVQKFSKPEIWNGDTRITDQHTVGRGDLQLTCKVHDTTVSPTMMFTAGSGATGICSEPVYSSATCLWETDCELSLILVDRPVSVTCIAIYPDASPQTKTVTLVPRSGETSHDVVEGDKVEL